MSNSIYAGIDLGSISLNLVIIDSNSRLQEGIYVRTKGQPLHTLLRVLQDLSSTYELLDNIFITGSGRNILSELFSCNAVNEIIAHAEGASYLNPDIRTIIEIGGQDSKLILLNRDEKTGKVIISDNCMNDVCAAGTGSFLDQQAKRLGLPVDEFGSIALKSVNPSPVAGRCSVFAKSDMIHLQQEGVPVEDIVAGLCFALARGFLANLGKGRDLPKPVQFQGGVAANRGVRKAFETLLNLPEGDLLIPQHYLLMGAYGASLYARKESSSKKFSLKEFITILEKEIKISRNHRSYLPALPFRESVNNYTNCSPCLLKTTDVFLGIDVGAVSANLVLLDMSGHVIGKKYLFTSGKPVEIVKQCLLELGKEFESSVRVKAVGVTGSGRYFIGHLVGADTVINEITAQAKGALHFDPSIDTLFEIGGQDAKYIRFDHGAVVDFEMNKVCAAGTGSFLEEQAARLNIDIKNDFSRLAFNGKTPGDLGTRCTVFMESDLIHHQQSGLEKENLVAGLAYAIVNNYIEKVVDNRKIGENIYFQGGVAGNSAVVAAMENITGKKINVHVHHDVTGAIGAALAAQEVFIDTEKTSFAGFDIQNRDISIKSFTCHLCANVCHIRKIYINGEEKGSSGSICGRFDRKEQKELYDNTPDLIEERKILLTGAEQDLPENAHDPAVTGDNESNATRHPSPVTRHDYGINSPVIGIPRSIFFFEDYPFWKVFFTELGYKIILSDETSGELVYNGLKRTQSETCFPVKVAYGHIENLLKKGIKKIFFPSIAELFRTRDDLPRTYNCPYIQGLPYMLQAAFEHYGVEFITPILYFSGTGWKEELLTLGRKLGKSQYKTEHAINMAEKSLKEFQNKLVERGKDFLDKKDGRTVILLGKAHHLFDEGQNMHTGKKLRKSGVTAIPYDFLPLSEVKLDRAFENVVWKNSHDLMRAALIARKHNIPVIMLTNFGCGPDSFAMKYLDELLRGHPFMVLEVDEHTADAGVITRIEAFLDTIKVNHKTEPLKFRDYNIIIKRDLQIYNPFIPDPKIMSLLKDRTLYFHYVAPGMNKIMESAFSIAGIKTKSLPPQDDRTEELGRKYASGLECHPFIVTTGDIVKLTEEPDFNPHKTAILLMSYDGCCRYSQYGLSYKIALNNLGFTDVLIVNPLVSGRYEELSGMFGLNFTQAIWKGWLCAGVLENYLLSRRPYELEKGKTDEAYLRAVDILSDALKHFASLNYIYDDKIIEALKKGIKLIKSVPVDMSIKRPKIGVFGEFFTVLSTWANQDLFRKFESMGVEVCSNGLFTLVNFMSFFSERYHEEEMKNKGNMAGYYYYKIKKNWLLSWAKRIEKELDKDTDYIRLLPTEKMVRNISSFINPDLDPVSTTYLARAIDLADRGIAGINYLIVLNCMLSNMTIPIFKRILSRYNNLPFLATPYDGFKETNTVTRLEAFVHQAKLYYDKYRREG
ncbi:MAG: acyl-CoA dehydratase activase [Candidatus Eremiobacterota bacterium]